MYLSVRRSFPPVSTAFALEDNVTVRVSLTCSNDNPVFCSESTRTYSPLSDVVESFAAKLFKVETAVQAIKDNDSKADRSDFPWKTFIIKPPKIFSLCLYRKCAFEYKCITFYSLLSYNISQSIKSVNIFSR